MRLTGDPSACHVARAILPAGGAMMPNRKAGTYGRKAGRKKWQENSKRRSLEIWFRAVKLLSNRL